MVAKIKSAVNWANNGPFDKEVGVHVSGEKSRVITIRFQHFLSVSLAAGSVKNFYSLNGTLEKPWSDTGQ
jgi:hypothetical protein